MKHQAIILSLLFTSSILIAGGNIEPVQETITTVNATSTASSTSTPSLPSVTQVEGISNPDDLVYRQRSTGLLWQDEAYTDEEMAAFKREHSNQKAGNFAHARQYCESLEYAGYLNWRLPTSDELIDIYKDNIKVFTYSKENDFWSSTPTTRDRYYVVFPSDSMRYARSARQSNFIRCVREAIK
jgi:hypothetical protein